MICGPFDPVSGVLAAVVGAAVVPAGAVGDGELAALLLPALHAATSRAISKVNTGNRRCQMPARRGDDECVMNPKLLMNLLCIPLACIVVDTHRAVNSLVLRSVLYTNIV